MDRTESTDPNLTFSRTGPGRAHGRTDQPLVIIGSQVVTSRGRCCGVALPSDGMYIVIEKL